MEEPTTHSSISTTKLRSRLSPQVELRKPFPGFYQHHGAKSSTGNAFPGGPAPVLRCWEALRSRSAAAFRCNRAYSTERLFALHEYCEKTSIWRVASVLLLTSTPALLVMLLFDAAPLQDPREGWEANTRFWVRTCVSTCVMCSTILLEAQLIVPDVKLTAARKLTIAAAVAVGYTIAMMVLAHYWRFPVPFTFVVGSTPFGVCFNVCVLASLGCKSRKTLERYSQFFNCIALQSTMLTVYPAYNAAFLSLEGTGSLQLTFVLLLPIIKLSFKYLLTLVQPDDEDLAPALHASVDIFDALYMTKCMQSTGTIAVGAAIILVDVVQSCFAVRVLANQTQSIQATLRARGTSSRASQSTSALGVSHAVARRSLLPLVFELLGKMHEQADTQTLRFGSRSFSVSTQSEAELSRLRSIHASSKSSLRGLPMVKPKTVKARQIMASAAAVGLSELIPVLTAAKITPPPSQQPIELPDSSLSHEAKIFKETVCLLHESESVVVVEYVEAVVPVMYAIYISILVRLPNAKYYQDLQLMTDDRVQPIVRNILVYALLELLSLVFVARLLKRSFGILVLYQLAFAPENDWRIYQCNLVIWFLIIFQFLLLHNGCDFTFQFQWIYPD